MNDWQQKLILLGITPLRERYHPLEPTEIEDMVGERLPGAYRAFIARYGQSTFDREIRFSSGDCPGFDVELFFGDRRCPEYAWDPTSLAANIEIYRERMPPSMIPIGEAENDLLCLGISELHRGRVFLWKRELELDEGQGEAKFDNVRMIAPSFESFIARLECYSSG